MRGVFVRPWVDGSDVQLFVAPLSGQLQRARDVQLWKLRVRSWVFGTVLRLRRLTVVSDWAGRCGVLWSDAWAVQLRRVPVHCAVHWGVVQLLVHAVFDGEQRAGVLWERDVCVRCVRVRSSSDGTDVRVRLVTSVSQQLHVPAGCVQVWRVRVCSWVAGRGLCLPPPQPVCKRLRERCVRVRTVRVRPRVGEQPDYARPRLHMRPVADVRSLVRGRRERAVRVWNVSVRAWVPGRQLRDLHCVCGGPWDLLCGDDVRCLYVAAGPVPVVL